MKKMFPDHEITSSMMKVSKQYLITLKVADQDGYSNVKIVVGSDRVLEFDNLTRNIMVISMTLKRLIPSLLKEMKITEGVVGMSALR